MRLLLKRIGSSIHHFGQSVKAQYGTLFPGVLPFIFYSFLRRNRFVVFIHDTDCQYQQNMPICDLAIHTPDREELDHIRFHRTLPREFHCDQTFGVSRCYLATIDGQAAYIHWIFRSEHPSRFLHMQSQDAEVNYMLALPAYSGLGICSQVLSRTVADLKAEGIQRVFCVVHDRNIASIKAVNRAGFRHYREVTSIGPFNSKLKV